MARKKIGLVGGGQIGGILALLAGQKEMGDVVILDIEPMENHIKGKALDMMESAPVQGFDANLSGTADYADLKGCDVVIVTAGLPRKPGMTREDLLETNVKIIKSVAEGVKANCPDAFCIIVTNPLDSMVYAFHKVSGLPENKVVGMAGVLDASRFRSFVSMELGVSVEDIAGTVLGGHGPTMVPLPRLMTVGGVPLTEMMDAETIEAVAKRTREAGTEIVKLLGNGSAYFSPAASAIEMAEAYIKDKKRVLPCAARLNGEYLGIKGYFLGVPAIIGAGGIEKVVPIKLTADEEAMLKNSFDAVEKSVAETNEMLVKLGG